MCFQKGQTPVRREGCLQTVAVVRHMGGHLSSQPAPGRRAADKIFLIHLLPHYYLQLVQAMPMSALFPVEKLSRRPTCNLMLPSAAPRPPSPTPQNEPLCGCSPLGTALVALFGRCLPALILQSVPVQNSPWHLTPAGDMGVSCPSVRTPFSSPDLSFSLLLALPFASCHRCWWLGCIFVREQAPHC